MRCFSLISSVETCFYDELIVPLLQRMLNLEKLELSIAAQRNALIDGNHMKINIINHLPRLNKFTFHIRSLVKVSNPTHVISNEEMQDTLTDLRNNQVISYVDHFLKEKFIQCHFYSYPYTWYYYHNITHSFPGGLFPGVRDVSLFDDRPFEHQFFVRIAQAFPIMEKLSLINLTPQTQTLNNNEHLIMIEYPHLTKLDFMDVDDDYVEQFLLNTKTHLLKSICLDVTYESLKKITHNFTRNTTRFNAAKVNILRIWSYFKISKRLTEYFPYAKISRFP